MNPNFDFATRIIYFATEKIDLDTLGVGTSDDTRRPDVMRRGVCDYFNQIIMFICRRLEIKLTRSGCLFQYSMLRSANVIFSHCDTFAYKCERHANSYARYQSTPVRRTESDNRSEGDYRKEDNSQREQTAIKQRFYERQEQERNIIQINIATEEILR